ncbi:site-specific integrase [Muricauda sp. SCSIO 64092]|uniref:site-specific integrase n=1 Tax=Allomuricauda sp. SCSIO 64092 TaxID=2908842 RepID=UPI001FF4C3DB|nr:site-specific integrase [Muricauda sp. SCSIO 64092]UOY05716.1 site-specific integrase [Muricauda sp. SCSIO 64092]
MKTSKTFSINFWLKKKAKKKNGTIPIYARIRVDGVPADISIQRSTLEEHWCQESGRIKHKVKWSKGTNDYLDDVYAKLLECHKELHSEGLLITAIAVKMRYLGTDKIFGTLVELISYHRTNEIPKLERGTAKNYGATEKYLLRFIKKKFNVSDLGLLFINYAFIVDFERFLRTCKPLKKNQPLTNNGIMKHLERFKKMIGIASKFGCLKQNPFDLYQMKFDTYDSAYLEDFELEILESVSIPVRGWEVVRDIFVFSCYTGLSYIEVKSLKRGDIVQGIDGNLWINVIRKKTKTPVQVPLLMQAQEILNKYSHYPKAQNEFSLLPVFSNQKVNKYIKEIATLAGINKRLTFHVARHTFATTVTLTNDVPMETVSKLLGHTKLSTTKRYARVVEKKISKDIGQLKIKLKTRTKSISYQTRERGTPMYVVR